MEMNSISIDPYIDLLRQNGLKVTPKRKAVLGLFLRENRCMGPHEIREKLRKHISTLGLPTVYRILEELKDIGVLMQVPSDNRLLNYMLCRMPESHHHHHHHFVCMECKKVEEVEYCNFDAVARFIEINLKGTVKSHSLHIEGLCSECRQ